MTNKLNELKETIAAIEQLLPHENEVINNTIKDMIAQVRPILQQIEIEIEKTL